MSVLLSAHRFCHRHCVPSQGESSATSLQSRLSCCIYSQICFLFPGRQILFKWLTWRKATALEYSRQEGCPVEWGGWPNTPHYCSQFLPEREVRGHRHLWRPVHLLRHRGTEQHRPRLPVFRQFSRFHQVSFSFSMFISALNITLKSTWGPPEGGIKLDVKSPASNLCLERTRYHRHNLTNNKMTCVIKQGELDGFCLLPELTDFSDFKWLSNPSVWPEGLVFIHEIQRLC